MSHVRLVAENAIAAFKEPPLDALAPGPGEAATPTDPEALRPVLHALSEEQITVAKAMECIVAWLAHLPVPEMPDPEPVDVLVPDLSLCQDCGAFRGHGHECPPAGPVGGEGEG